MQKYFILASSGKGVAHNRSFLLALLFLPWSLLTAAAENLVPSGGFEDAFLTEEWGQPADIEQDASDSTEGDFSLRFLRTGYATSPELIQVEPGQSYSLRASLKVPEQMMAGEAADFYVIIRLLPHDENGNPIPSGSVHAFPETQTTLARAAQEGDTSVYLAGEAWEKRNATLVAFGAAGDLSDLPNSDVVDIVDIIPGTDGASEVRLGSPLARPHSVGTPVRMHRLAPYPMIVAQPTAEWMEHTLQLTGSSEPGKVSENQLWHGTRSVRVQIKPVSNDPSNPNLPIHLLVDGISFGP